MKILSFGCGKQTVAIAAMCIHGKFEKPDYAIFADPQSEDKDTYKYLEWIKPKFGEAGIKFISCTAGNIMKDALREGKFATMPVFTKDKNGKPGMLLRQCTNEYKIQPVIQAIRKQILGLKKGQKYKGEPVELWLGFSMDEAANRINDNPLVHRRPKWLVARYPLVEKHMFIDNCMAYLERIKWPLPPKSACIICPFKSDISWKELKEKNPDQFEEACQFDEQLRSHRVSIKNPVYLHRSLLPLREIKFENQIELFGCRQGFCGV